MGHEVYLFDVFVLWKKVMKWSLGKNIRFVDIFLIEVFKSPLNLYGIVESAITLPIR